MKTAAKSIGITALIAYLFYDHIAGIVTFPVVYLIVRKLDKKRKKEEEKKEIEVRFLDMLRFLGTNVLAGFSIENAWRESEKDLKKLYGENDFFCREVEEISVSVGLNISLENLLTAFAAKMECEDMISFAEIFQYAKRSGGNFSDLINSIYAKLQEKQETKREIEVLIASKRMEQRIMNVVPIGMLAYLRLSSGGYLDVIYHNIFGVLFMTCCIGVYLLAMFWSSRLAAIEV